MSKDSELLTTELTTALSGFGRGGGILTALLHIFAGPAVTDLGAKLNLQLLTAPFYPVRPLYSLLAIILGAPLSLVTMGLVTESFVTISGSDLAPVCLVIVGLICCMSRFPAIPLSV